MRDEFLKVIQTSFPLTERPFKEIGEKFGIGEEEALNFYKELKESRIIRQTCGILDTKKVGYLSTLVAFSVDDIENAAGFINTHPGVSHNYERDHEVFNLWFTLAVPPDSLLGLEKTIDIMAQKTRAKLYMILPNIKMFKIGVILDTGSFGTKKENLQKRQEKEIYLQDLHKKILLHIQRDIPLSLTPFEDTIRNINLDYETFFEKTKDLIDAGYIRRFASLLNHRNAGFKYNAMVVWNIPDEIIDTVGEKIASYSAVTHCYQRPRYKEWNYNIFSMIHGKNEDEVDSVIDSISKETGLTDYRKLYSTREFKKSRINYFSEQFYHWEKSFA